MWNLINRRAGYQQIPQNLPPEVPDLPRTFSRPPVERKTQLDVEGREKDAGEGDQRANGDENEDGNGKDDKEEDEGDKEGDEGDKEKDDKDEDESKKDKGGDKRDESSSTTSSSTSDPPWLNGPVWLKTGCCYRPKCHLLVNRDNPSIDFCTPLYHDQCRCNKGDHCERVEAAPFGSGFAIVRVYLYEEIPIAQIEWIVKWSKLSSEVIGVELRGPVLRCLHKAPTLVDLGTPMRGDCHVINSAYVSCAELQEILNENTYITVRTEKYPDCIGEIAGRLKSKRKCHKHASKRLSCLCHVKFK